MEDDIHLQYQVKKVSAVDSGKSTETTGRSFQRPSLVYPACTKPGSLSAVFELDLAAVAEANQHSKEASAVLLDVGGWFKAWPRRKCLRAPIPPCCKFPFYRNEPVALFFKSGGGKPTLQCLAVCRSAKPTPQQEAGSSQDAT